MNESLYLKDNLSSKETSSKDLDGQLCKIA